MPAIQTPHRILRVRSSGRRVARWAIDRLEDALSIQADRLGNDRWIPVEHQTLVKDAQDPSPHPQNDPLGWYQDPRPGITGICRLERARIRFFEPRQHQTEPGADRRAGVFTRSARRLGHPHAPRTLARQIRAGGVKRAFRRRDATHLEGRVALLGNAVFDANNYYHFWLDSIGDFLFLQHALPADLQPERLLLSHAGQPWQDEILDMLGIDRARIIHFSDQPHIITDELLIPVRDKGGARLTPGLVDCVRKATPLPSDPPHPGRALYITRKDSSRRPVHNENAVRDRVQRRGFEVHALSGMPVADQIELFTAADIVVATHGAGLTNLMWCQQETTVIELVPDRHRMPCFRDICRQRNLNHHAIRCPQPGTEKGLAAPMTVPLEQLDAALQHHRPA